jgi:hypothetical protein
MTANINFINLRSAQRTIVDESRWMGGELEGRADGERDEHSHIVEARRLVGSKSSGRRCAARRRSRQDGLARGGDFGDSTMHRRDSGLPLGRGNAGEGVWARDRGRRVGLARLTRRGRASAGARTARRIEEHLLPRLKLLPEAGNGARLLGRRLHRYEQSLLLVRSRIDGRVRGN